MLNLAYFPPLIDPEDACHKDKRFIPDAELDLGAPIPCRIVEPWVGLMSEPNIEANRLSELLFGEAFILLKTQKDWTYGQSVLDGYIGWLPTDTLTNEPDEAPNAIITSALATVYEQADSNAPSLMTLPFAAQVLLDGEKATNGFIALLSGGWLSTTNVMKLPYSGVTLLDSAESFLSAPYLWGGRTIKGLDCSGLVQLSLLMAGLRVHRDSDLQWASLGTPIDREIAVAGDLVFFLGHVGIMVDKNRLIHANQTMGKVSIDPLDDVIGWVDADLKTKGSNQSALLGFKRIL